MKKDNIDEMVRRYLDSPEYQKKIANHTVSSPQTIIMVDNIKERLEDFKIQAKKDFDALGYQMKQGFDGVHARQDHTNGNVLKNTEYRIATEAVINNIKWMMGFFGISNIGVIIYFILTNIR